MLDPVSVFAAVTGSLRLAFRLSKYFAERKERRRQQQYGDQPHEHQITSFSPLPHNYFQNSYYYPTHSTIIVQYVLLQAPLPAPPHTIISGSSASRSPGGAGSNYLMSTADYHPHSGRLGGRIDLVVPQEAPHNVGMLCRERLGMRTGGETAFHYNDDHAYDHWNSLQRGCFDHSPGAIAVVDWTGGNIDMFVQSHAVYFRTYRIHLSPRDVSVFADLYKENEVFSGEIYQQKLTRCNKDIKVVDNLGHLLHSTNSWRSLGMYDGNVVDVEYEEPVFIRIVRGAVFGLVCCLYESPCEINVDMDTAGYHQCNVVRITHKENSTLAKRENCCFSVFSFNTKGWATEDILVG